MNHIKQKTTVHTSRTLMFAELSRVMDHSAHDLSFSKALGDNVAGKDTRSNQLKTNRYLRQLYGFDHTNHSFACFNYFWQITESTEKPLITILYALGRDHLLSASIDTVIQTPVGAKVTVEKFEEQIENTLPSKYSDITRRSIAKNLASSWKQAGYITGKVKNIRIQTHPGYHVVAFSLLMAYLDRLRGDFIITSKWVKALDINDQQLRELAVEAARRDLLQYQYVGGVTAISFTNLFNKLEIHGIQG